MTRPGRRIAVAALGLALLLCSAGSWQSPAQSQQFATVKIGVIPSDFSAQPYYAQAEGMFEKHGLHAEITGIANGGAIAAAILSGSLDVGYDSIVQLALAVDKGLPLVLLAPAYVYQDSTATTGLLSVTKESGITTAKELDGKVVAVGGLNNVTQLALEAWIDEHGGNSKSVHYIELPASEFAAALRAGRIAAAPIDSSLDPNLGKAGDALRLLGKTFDSIAPTYLAGGWVATKSWIAAHPTEARAFATAMKESAAWANGHHHESALVVAKQLDEPVAQVEEYPRVVYGTTAAPAAIQPSIDVAAKYGFIKQGFPASSIIDPLAR